MNVRNILQTGQIRCYDDKGAETACNGSGQDGEFRRGLPWPDRRFTPEGNLVRDHLTGLSWTRHANPAEFPLTWQESLEYIGGMNRESAFGFSDWRLPNRRELRSLISYQTRRPALPDGHPFIGVFLDWYWTSTSAAINTAYAWYVHMDGARMFYGNKKQYYLVWPVRGTSPVLPTTGQQDCFGADGRMLSECDPLQDQGRSGAEWPEQRFIIQDDTVLDNLTGLKWLRNASLSTGPVNWQEAFELVRSLNTCSGRGGWRLPNINELESLVDCSRSTPALPAGHPFAGVQEVYWSSTTSAFEPDWAWALYLVKGALGVGVKNNPVFHVWPVR